MMAKWFTGLMIWLFMLLAMPVISGEGYVANPKENVFILGGDIGMSYQDYTELKTRLANAISGEEIFIRLYMNRGGVSAVGEDLREAIMSSRATVITEARIQASSAALDILFAGDRVILLKVPFKGQRSAIAVAHLSFIPGPNWEHIRTPGMIASDIESMQYYRHFLTDDEWSRVKAGEDVWLQAADLCRQSRFKIVDTKSYCIIRGVNGK